MFGLFKKKSNKEKLLEQYKKLLKEAHRLSHVDRKASDATLLKADNLLKEIENLKE